MTPKLGDWQTAAKNKAAQAAVDMPAAENDVVEAFRWILGREVTDPTQIQTLLSRANGDRRLLRLILLRSPEFARQLDTYGLLPESFTDSVLSGEPRLRSSIGQKKLIFIHIPKAGGTSLHYHLLGGVDENKVCPKRHNDLLLSPKIFLQKYTLFSGHYDIRAADIIPGEEKAVVTMLREPKERLISLYTYLAAHRPERIRSMDFKMAEAAKSNNFEGFLKAALRINPAAIDNTYARTFGSTLPISRWETAADRPWMDRLATLNDSMWRQVLDRAKLRLRSLDAIGFVETFDESCKFIMNIAGIKTPDNFERLKDIERITEDTVGFEPVEKPKVGQSDILQYVTRFDSEIYDTLRSK